MIVRLLLSQGVLFAGFGVAISWCLRHPLASSLRKVKLAALGEIMQLESTYIYSRTLEIVLQGSMFAL